MERLIRCLSLVAMLGIASCDDHPVGPGSNPHELLLVRDVGGNSEIFAMRADGSGAVRLTNHPAGDHCPRWSPNGRKIVFGSTRDSIQVNERWVRTSDLYVMNADGSSVTRLTRSAEPHGCASWSPDGRRLVYGRLDRETRTYNIFAMDPDGSNVVRLTRDSRDSSYPQWSPDGTAILFLTNREAGWSKLYIMNPDGSGQRSFGDLCHSNVLNMSWSPDGTHVAFDCDGSYGTEVHIIRADGTGRTRISAPVGPGAHGYDQTPVWSPDGKSLAISRNSGGNLDVYRVDIATGTATRLTTDPGHEWPTDWRQSGSGT